MYATLKRQDCVFDRPFMQVRTYYEYKLDLSLAASTKLGLDFCSFLLAARPTAPHRARTITCFCCRRGTTHWYAYTGF
jgi:hypothetical protein